MIDNEYYSYEFFFTNHFLSVNEAAYLVYNSNLDSKFWVVIHDKVRMSMKVCRFIDSIVV